MANLSIKNPFSHELIGELPLATRAEALAALASAQKVFQSWRNSSAWERASLLSRASARLKEQKEVFAALLCSEAGKPISLARGEVDRAVGVLEWAAAEAQRFSGELLRTDVSAGGRRGFGIHTRFPRGVILGITPFNFPLNLVAHKVAPAIACGCSIIIKPSPYTPLTAKKFCELFSDGPKGLVQVVFAEDSLAAEMTHAAEVAMVSFTGSAKVGWTIRKQIVQKPVALELGGNAWVAVLEDVSENQFPAIAKRIVNAAFGYAGQSCISVQNVAVAKAVWPAFRKVLADAVTSAPFGDPRLPEVVCGPLVHSLAAERVRGELLKAPLGSEMLRSLARKGESENVVDPALVVLADDWKRTLSVENSLTQEEIFGPVMVVRAIDAVEDLRSLVNSGRYGLQTGVYTSHWSTIEMLYRELEVGGLIINDVPTTRYDHQPYGGVKESGMGREGVRYAMDEMTDSKFLSLSSQVL